MLDTLKISKRFIKAGMTKEEAEVIAKVFKEREDAHFEKLATKEGMENLKGHIDHLKEYIKVSTILMTMGFAALGFLIAYLKTC